MSPFLKTAIKAAEAGQVVIEKYYRGEYSVELKPDQSPVTIADVETERVIKHVILEAFPDHGFEGEETGRTEGDSEYTWLIDPIDGTKSFIREYPFFSTQIALMKNDEIILGVSNAPLFNELAYAEIGQGAWLNSKRVNVSDVDQLESATISIANLKTLATTPQWARLGEIVGMVDRSRGFGDFYQYHLLAAGKIDIVLEADVNILDIAALSLIVHEAGGVFTDLQGAPVNTQTISVLATGSRQLHETVLKTLQGG